MLPCERNCRTKTKKWIKKIYRCGAFENIEPRVLYLHKCAQYFSVVSLVPKVRKSDSFNLNPSVFRDEILYIDDNRLI